MEFSSAGFLASFLVGTVGLGLFVYGRKQLRTPQLVVGIAMMAYPYFIESAAVICAVAGALLIGLAFVVRMGW